MIFVTRFDGKKIVVNADLIETIESTPDTILTTTTGKKITVKENVEEVVNLVKAYKKEISFPVVKENEKL
ncbi:MAG: flagellar FlbD family protein [Candidatus Goldbacteria bacterium]|nr:flagellar FlbD family protein [Candidatus Goldiibacteriota bacterium]